METTKRLNESVSRSLARTEGVTEYVTRKEIADRLGLHDARIRPYADADTTNEFFGGVTGMGKGVRYPAESVGLFEQALQDTPAQFREKLITAIATKRAGGSSSADALTRRGGGTDLPAMMDSMSRLLRVVVQEAIQEVAPVREDKLLTLKEAREESGLSFKTIRGLDNVTGEGRYPKYKRSVVMQKVKEL